MGRNLDTFILQNFQKAIDSHEILAFYQPVIRTSSRRLCGLEALARWIDPERGMIHPNEFIPVLEREGLIHLLDTAILRQVCARIRRAIDSGETPIPVSVNLSRLDFTHCDIFAEADNIVSGYRIPHDFVRFEITESVMAEQKDLLVGIVDRFRSAGYQVWMDDFGSAYSSLNVLKEFSFDELKLDMSFLRPFNERSKRIINAIVKMAKLIDIHTLAEGVETEEQFEYLQDIGCEKVQGYLFGKPQLYEQALASMRSQAIEIETPQDRIFYDEIGKIDYLSPVPLMMRAERDNIESARQLNSIPLCLAVFSADHFRVLFFNTAFEAAVQSSGMFTEVFTLEKLRQPQPLRALSDGIINLVDSVKVNGQGRMLFTANNQYYEIRAIRVAQTADKFCVLVSTANLTKDTRSDVTSYLDDSARRIYAQYDRITHLNVSDDTIQPLYTDTSEDLLSKRRGIRQLLDEYSDKYIYPEDKTRFVRTFDPALAQARIRQDAGNSFSEVFRTSVRHGKFVWKEYTLLRIDAENYLLLIRNIHEVMKETLARSAPHFHEEGPYAPSVLWNNLIRSDLFRVFWKDRNRRFLGASRAFLDFYGFASAREIIGKSDEDMGWHVHPDLFMNDEYQVIHEGATFRNVPGKCIRHGENIDIFASKTPLYDVNGEITGLLGWFVDSESLGIGDRRDRLNSRQDLLTGLLNSRGISENAEAFHDEYCLRGTDFVRIHIGINDFDMINEQYGFDFGDKVLRLFGQELRQAFGQSSAVGRYAGRQFTVLQQVKGTQWSHDLCKRIKDIGNSIHEIDGKPVTLYLSVGYALYSEFQNMEELTKNAEMRMLADSDQHTSSRSRLGHAEELFGMFDDIPFPYAVFHVTHSEESGQCDAVFFYVNHQFEQLAQLTEKDLLGHSVRELFPFLGESWYQDAENAAIDGQVVKGEFVSAFSDNKRLHFTIRQIIHPGYCAIMCMDAPPGGTE